MKKQLFIMSVLLLGSSTAFSQSEVDALKYAQSELSGTARYLGMGGAFGALGGDISAMYTNPAGLAVYRSSEVVTTLSLSSISAKTNWTGVSNSDTRTKVNFDNIAYVGYFPTGNDEGILGWNVGFSYNRLKNYRRNYRMSGTPGYSISDYAALRATNNEIPANVMDEFDNSNAYRDVNDWTSVLSYNAGFIDPFNGNNKTYYSAFGDGSGNDWHNYNLNSAALSVDERGSIDQYDIAFGMNISDLVLLGATVAITDLSYDTYTKYDELFENNSSLYYDNNLSTDGTGYSFNVGAIVRPADFLRLGVAYNSPTWYKMTDYYYGAAGSKISYTDNNGRPAERTLDAETPTENGPTFSKYEYRSPDKWLFSAAAIIGQSALISVDYELTNYKNMKMHYEDGEENIGANSAIKQDFGMGNTVRVGAEYKVTPQFAIRIGGAWSGNSIKNSDLKDGLIEVQTVGTLTNYTIDRNVANYTVGFGYRFTPNFYMDLACVYRMQKEDARAFSNIWLNENISSGVDPSFVENPSATLKTNTTKVALTLGYKF